MVFNLMNNEDMNQEKKRVYVSPTVEVIRIVVEKNVATQSPIQCVNIIDWDYETPEDDPNNNADIWLDL